MTGQGVVLVCLAALAMLALVFHQLLRHRLYVGYAVAWVIVIFGTVCLVTIPPLTHTATRIVDACFPSSGLTLISLAFVISVLIYFSIQLSILSERVTKIAQTLAISNLENGNPPHMRSIDPENQ
jgi:hypothetical protein